MDDIHDFVQSLPNDVTKLGEKKKEFIERMIRDLITQANLDLSQYHRNKSWHMSYMDGYTSGQISKIKTYLSWWLDDDSIDKVNEFVKSKLSKYEEA